MALATILVSTYSDPPGGGPYPYVPSKAEATLRTRCRKDLADLYRKMHRDNSAFARLFYRRMRDVEKRFSQHVLFGAPR